MMAVKQWLSLTMTMCLLVTCGQYGQIDSYAYIHERKIQRYAYTIK